MNDEVLKIKYYNAPIKWAITIFFLMWNLLLLAYDRCVDKNDFIVLITVIVSANVLAIFSFVLLSIFPRRYYIFDDNGITVQNNRGEKRFYVEWDNINKIEYIYELFGIIPGGLEFKYIPGYKNPLHRVVISPKDARLVYQSISKAKEIIDRKHINL